MRSQDSRGSGRRGGRGRRGDRPQRNETRTPQPPAKKSFWQKLVSFFTSGSKPATTKGPRPQYQSATVPNGSASASARGAHKPVVVEVTSPKLYVGNLSYDATESDLSELFNGVGQVMNAEIVSHKGTEKSKGFGFVTMTTTDEAKRAVVELHDKDFMGRKMVVTGSKAPGERETDYRG